MPLLEIVRGDITHIDVDAIVNAANETLLGGGGVDGAIHRAAGPALLHACKALPEISPSIRCPIGEARITPGFDLPARFVIHTVGPRFHDGVDEPTLLASCYRQSLALAAAQRLHSIAFPSISTGAFGYPIERASEIAVRTCRAFFEQRSTVRRVVLVAHSVADAGVLARSAATPARTTLH